MSTVNYGSIVSIQFLSSHVPIVTHRDHSTNPLRSGISSNVVPITIHRFRLASPLHYNGVQRGNVFLTVNVQTVRWTTKIYHL